MFYEPLDSLEVSISAIRAFNHLVTVAIDQGDDFSYLAAGIQRLLDTQVDILSAKTEEIRSECLRLEKANAELSAESALHLKRNENNGHEFGAMLAPNSGCPQIAMPGADYYQQNQMTIARLQAEGRSASEISVLTGLAKDRVRVFIDTMPDQIKEAVMREGPRELRDSFITERIRDGYDPSEIAQALNLKRVTVERVIGKLLGTNMPGAIESDDQKAVNE